MNNYIQELANRRAEECKICPENKNCNFKYKLFEEDTKCPLNKHLTINQWKELIKNGEQIGDLTIPVKNCCGQNIKLSD